MMLVPVPAPRSYLFSQISFIISPSLLELVIAFVPMYIFNRLMVRLSLEACRVAPG